MDNTTESRTPAAADEPLLAGLADDLVRLRGELVALERTLAGHFAQIHEAFRLSAVNLAHYVAFRRRDLRELQARLAAAGLSSLGRAESHVLGNLDAVLRRLGEASGRPWAPDDVAPIATEEHGRRLLDRHAEALLGSAPAHRDVRIMVTMPREAAEDYPLMRQMLAAGMNCARINCAHDDPDTWVAIAQMVRKAERDLGKPCRVLMDLGGPKLRTGRLVDGPQVVRIRPQRDILGKVVAPARVLLTPPEGAEQRPHGAGASLLAGLPVTAGWLARLRVGDRIEFRDARDASRALIVTAADGANRWVETTKTCYVARETVLTVRSRGAHHKSEGRVGALPPVPQPIVLHRGDTLVLTRSARPGKPAVRGADGRVTSPASVSCSLPEVFASVRAGERIWLDDGKIGGVIRHVGKDRIGIEITHARPKGEKLLADKGINLPDSRLDLPALTHKDIADLDLVVRHADIVGMSFVHSAADVHDLQAHLQRRDAGGLGIMLKIETRAGFEMLPELLVAAMGSPSVGVMIARGDLAVECGYERLAEVQEEILWLSAAAHVPVIWATQVLENLAKRGVASRAEITDAAMSNRAECVMLNKGPHIVEAIRALDDILCRMQTHQRKKTPMLRKLRLVDALDPGSTSRRPRNSAPAPAPMAAPSLGASPVTSRRRVS